jgi:hypothetical protein
MKVVRRVLLIFFLIESFALPIFLLAVKHYQLESETAEWLVSIMPGSDAALEDRRAAADMIVSYGELAAEKMLAYTAFAWSAVFIYWRFFGRAARGTDPESLRSGSVEAER